jgi:hypothetical protein
VNWASDPLRIDARFAGQIVENLIAVIERDFAVAATRLYPSDRLDDFSEVGRARRSDVRSPYCAVFAGHSDTPTGTDGGRVAETHLFTVETWVIHSDPDEASRLLDKYVRVLHLVIAHATEADMEEGLSNPSTPIWDVIDHDYAAGEPRQSQQGNYISLCQLTVEVKLHESI